MRRRSFVALSVVTLFMTASSIAPIAMAAGTGTGNPVIDFLEKMIQPVLSSIQTDTTAAARNITAIQLGNSAILDALDTIQKSVTDTPKVVTVTGTILTFEQTTTITSLNSVADVPFGKIRRYSITINTVLLSPAVPGVISVDVEGDVLKSAGEGTGIIISQTDPAGRLNLAIVERPFAASNAHIRVRRATADGLGPREVYFSAYIELLP